MNRCLVAASSLLLTSALLVSGCNKPSITDIPATITNYASMVYRLRQVGATVEPTGDAPFPWIGFEEPFFSVQGKRIAVNGENVTVLEYDRKATMETEAETINPDGYSFLKLYTGISVGWIAPPHWYKAGRIIVMYIGKNQSVIDVLEIVLGPQFAGKNND